MKMNTIVFSLISALLLLGILVSPAQASNNTYNVVNNSYNGQESVADGFTSKATSGNSEAVVYHTNPNVSKTNQKAQQKIEKQKLQAQRKVEREKLQAQRKIEREQLQAQRKLEREKRQEERRIKAINLANERKLRKENAERKFNVRLTGGQEVPQGDVDGKGTAQVRVNPGNSEVCVSIRVKNIEPATSASIHKGGSGYTGPVVISLPTPNTEGYSNGCVGVDRGLALEMKNQPSEYYVNVKNAPYPDGAVRGQL